MSDTMGSPSAPLPERADVVIIGGGVMGLSTAYQLTRICKLSVVVIEQSYLVSGASGRNGGGVRMQFGDRENVALMMESIEMCRGLAQELGINTWFRQGGYLFLARTAQDEAKLQRNADLHQHVGAPTRLLGPTEAKEVVPQLDVSRVRVAAYNPEDGVVFPWAFVWGYAAQAVQRGAIIRTHTKVDVIEPESEGFTLRLSTGEALHANRVVNATGAWSVGINRALGIDFPNHPHRHEIMSSEPLKPFLDPLVAELGTGLYFSQSTRGEIVAGIRMPAEDDSGSATIDMRSSLTFLRLLSSALVDVMPLTASLRVLRQWAGPYDVSPDGDAIVGPTPGHPRLIQVCGFTGHGFMMAPVVGRMLARFLSNAERHPMFERWSPDRFRHGATRRREDMIIG